MKKDWNGGEKSGVLLRSLYRMTVMFRDYILDRNCDIIKNRI